MKPAIRVFQMGLKQIARDGMLLVLLPLPFFVGAVFKFGVPPLNGLLTETWSFSLLPWYGLVDGLLVCLAPMMAAMAAAFLLLDERDAGVSAFYQVTPAGGGRYLAARIGLPMLWAFAATLAAAALFHLSALAPGAILAAAFVSTLTGAALAMMVVAIARNRVEGLAVSKLMGISFVGLILVWFVPAPYSYLSSFLPSFWVGRLILRGADPLTLVLGAGCSCLWIALFSKRFLAQVG